MKALIVQASPHKNGNTAALLSGFIMGVRENNIEVEEIFLQDKNIKPCTACDFCHNSPYGKCAINDDMQDLYGKLVSSDLIVFATPVYWWNMASQLKIFIDRIYALMPDENNSRLKGKRAVLFMTYGGELPNSGPEIVEKSFRESAEYLGMKVLGVLGVCSCKPVNENEDALKKAYQIGKAIR